MLSEEDSIRIELNWVKFLHILLVSESYLLAWENPPSYTSRDPHHLHIGLDSRTLNEVWKEFFHSFGYLIIW